MPLNEVQEKQLRVLIGDSADPQYFTKDELDTFFDLEGPDLFMSAALALDTWAHRISYDEGGVSSGGLTISAGEIAASKRQAARMMRFRWMRA